MTRLALLGGGRMGEALVGGLLDAGQDPALVLLPPGVQDAGADAEGEHKAEDERDAEAESGPPPAPRPGGGLPVGHDGECRVHLTRRSR